jgi:hypothetical protein
LARRLDEALSAASRDWASADDHLSRALRLVELTYPAIAAALGDGDRAELSESWAQQRSVSVRDLLLQLVGPGAALSSDEVEVYGRACEAYDEALAHSFARLGWSMPTSAFAPFGVILEVRYDGAARRGAEPGLTVMRVPMALMPQIVPSGPEAIWSASGRAVVTQTKRETAADRERHSATLETTRSWLAEQNREPISGLGWMNTGAHDMRNVRPASSVAASWLWNDLKSLGLGTGTFPQLR